jgi:hypothetical protein
MVGHIQLENKKDKPIINSDKPMDRFIIKSVKWKFIKSTAILMVKHLWLSG